MCTQNMRPPVLNVKHKVKIEEELNRIRRHNIIMSKQTESPWGTFENVSNKKV